MLAANNTDNLIMQKIFFFFLLILSGCKDSAKQIPTSPTKVTSIEPVTKHDSFQTLKIINEAERQAALEAKKAKGKKDEKKLKSKKKMTVFKF